MTPSAPRPHANSVRSRIGEYSDEDPNCLVVRIPIAASEAECFPPDRVSGSGAVAIKLDQLLTGP